MPAAIAHSLRARPARMRLLDVACGTGRFLRFVKEAFPRLGAAGSTSPAPISRRRSSISGPMATFDDRQGRSASFSRPFLRPRNLRLSFSRGAARGAPDLAGEFARVLKPGGRLVFMDSLQLGDRPGFDRLLELSRSISTSHIMRAICRRICRQSSEKGLVTAHSEPVFLSKLMVLETAVSRSARDGAGNDRRAPAPSWPRPPARRGCRRRGRGGPWCDLGFLPAPGDGSPRGQDRRGRLDREAHDDVLAGRNAAQDAAGIVGQESPAVLACRISSAFSSPVSAAAAKPAPISTPLTALMLIIAAARSGRACRRRGAPARRDAAGHDLDDGAGGGAGLAHLVEMAAPPLDNGGIRREERIAVDLLPVPIVARRCCGPIWTRAPRMLTAGDRPCGRWRRRRRGSRSRAPRSGRRRDSRGARISPDRCSRHGRGGTCRDLAVVLGALVVILDQSAIGVPVVTGPRASSTKTPDRIFTCRARGAGW